MLFNSYLFLFLFLPVTLTAHYLFSAISPRLAAVWLCITSLVFYGWWNPQFVMLLMGSIAFNYIVSLCILSTANRPRLQLAVTTFGVATNIALLFHYKYFVTLVNFAGELGFGSGRMDDIILPLGISFFTFTQIGFLLDCRGGIVKERSLLSYVLFVTFFPHLIAGPILHHKEMMPQFAKPETYRFRFENLSIGGMLFVIGLAKKVLLADPIAGYADAGFAQPGELQFWSAWGTGLAYALQLYFDFSGYSDMALGLAKMFGIRFPLNFNSPYKASSIIDFWARWHMTLTRYLTAYLYYPMAMAVSRFRSKHNLPVGIEGVSTFGGFFSTIVWPTAFTMGLAGIWHGAGLQYVIFGMLHAFYLSVNHAWRIYVVGRTPVAERTSNWLKTAGYVLLTFAMVIFAQAFFRAENTQDALHLVQGMLGFRGFDSLPLVQYPANVDWADAGRLFIGRHLEVFHVLALLFIVWCLPNSHQIMGTYSPALYKPQPASLAFLRWQPTFKWLVILALLLSLCLMNLHKEARFLYFQF